MPTIPKQAQTDGSATFSPDAFFEAWTKGDLKPPQDNDFRAFILQSFGLTADDDYGYRATVEITLKEAQGVVELGGKGYLHKWYLDDAGQQISPPPAADVKAYTDIFRSTTNTANALKGLASNAKRDSIRADVAKHLQSLYQPPDVSRKIVVPKSKTHINPYLDLWAWTNENLEWAGPTSTTVKIRHSHPVLPIIFHHFGCICPTHEALETIRQVTNGRTIADIGSGNGFWSYMLRRVKDGKKNLDVVAIDNGISEWRTVWIPDTVETDGVKWLKQNAGGRDHVLLLVYPQVGLSFTSNTIAAYKGSTIVIAGSQNANGFTAFKELLTEWFADQMPTWHKVCQVPLPSFAGKDEALFVFENATVA